MFCNCQSLPAIWIIPNPNDLSVLMSTEEVLYFHIFVFTYFCIYVFFFFLHLLDIEIQFGWHGSVAYALFETRSR